jgi:chaperonin GroEL
VLKIGGASEVEVNEKKDRVEDALNATKVGVGGLSTAMRFQCVLVGGCLAGGGGSGAALCIMPSRVISCPLLNTTQAAVEEGIVAGGGAALLHAAKELAAVKEGLTNFDQQIGVQIIANALKVGVGGCGGDVVAGLMLQRALRCAQLRLLPHSHTPTPTARHTAPPRHHQVPMKTIASNAGVEGAVIIGKVEEVAEPSHGYDAATHEFCDMVAAGIIDPLKVSAGAWVGGSGMAGCVEGLAVCVLCGGLLGPLLPHTPTHATSRRPCLLTSLGHIRRQVVRTALVDAASVSSLITTSECVIVEAPEDKKAAPPMPDMGMY